MPPRFWPLAPLTSTATHLLTVGSTPQTRELGGRGEPFGEPRRSRASPHDNELSRPPMDRKARLLPPFPVHMRTHATSRERPNQNPQVLGSSPRGRTRSEAVLLGSYEAVTTERLQPRHERRQDAGGRVLEFIDVIVSERAEVLTAGAREAPRQPVYISREKRRRHGARRRRCLSPS
jgi:hypothetical protein